MVGGSCLGDVSEVTFPAGGLSRMDFFFPSSNRTLSKTIMAGEFKDCSEEKRDIRTLTAQSRWPAVGGILTAALISLVGYLVINRSMRIIDSFSPIQQHDLK